MRSEYERHDSQVQSAASSLKKQPIVSKSYYHGDNNDGIGDTMSKKRKLNEISTGYQVPPRGDRDQLWVQKYAPKCMVRHLNELMLVGRVTDTEEQSARVREDHCQ